MPVSNVAASSIKLEASSIFPSFKRAKARRILSIPIVSPVMLLIILVILLPRIFSEELRLFRPGFRFDHGLRHKPAKDFRSKAPHDIPKLPEDSSLGFIACQSQRSVAAFPLADNFIRIRGLSSESQGSLDRLIPDAALSFPSVAANVLDGP
uniref:Uncharacterized protein n=1 Tax=Candidatus Kentrum sp. TC TaxID=2126339 RepID=A0A451A7B7_9GAMM|nr:MAG: hypothetical protein BECKTC1821F_GA0114240_10658 [Candidatus Kentron sp. TC]